MILSAATGTLRCVVERSALQSRNKARHFPAHVFHAGVLFCVFQFVVVAKSLVGFRDCDLRRHGERIAARGGKNAKKRAVIAVARKLAVLLHVLWISGEVYEPLRNSKKAVAAA